MTRHILYCSDCKEYTMQDKCSNGHKTLSVKPAKFSPDDKWGKYRRAFKKEQKVL